MKPDFSDGRVLGLFVVAAAILVAVLVSQDPRQVPVSGGSEGHNHPEMDHSSPEAQKRMAIFHYNEGNQHLKAGQPKKAVHQYEMALGHTKILPQVYLNLSTALMRQKKFQEAFAQLQQAGRLAPQLPEVDYNIACFFALTGNPDQALKALGDAVRKGYNNRQELNTDPDLDSLRHLPEFIKLKNSL